MRLGQSLLKAIAVLHRLDMVHRDITPANIHLGQAGELRLLDLGVAVSAAEGEGGRIGGNDAEGSEAEGEKATGEQAPGQAGTPSYLAPEAFAGAAPAPSFDLYAAGVTLYHLLTRQYPYGEIEPFQTPRFGEPVPPTRWRPEIPGWLENLLLKAVARPAKERFQTAEEFLLALERGASRPLAPPPRQPLARRYALHLWQLVAVVSLALNLILLFALLGWH